METTRIIARVAAALFVLAILAASPARAESTFINSCFKTGHPDENFYITAHRGGEISAVVDECRGYEVFEIEDINGGVLETNDWVHIKTAHGKYWTADPNGNLAAEVEHTKGWERFRIDRQTGYYLTGDTRICQNMSFTLMSAHGLYVSAQNQGGGDVSADGPYRKTWERLVLETEEELCEAWSGRRVELMLLDTDEDTNSIEYFYAFPATTGLFATRLDPDSFESLDSEYFHFFWGPKGTLHLGTEAQRCATVEDDRMVEGNCDYDANQRWIFKDDGTLRPVSDPNRCATLDPQSLTWTTLDLGSFTFDFENLEVNEFYSIEIEDCDGDTNQRQWRLFY